mgnify:CR=1 FL=1
MKRPLFPGSLRASGRALALLLTLALQHPRLRFLLEQKGRRAENGGFLQKRPHRQCHRL